MVHNLGYWIDTDLANVIVEQIGGERRHPRLRSLNSAFSVEPYVLGPAKERSIQNRER